MACLTVLIYQNRIGVVRGMHPGTKEEAFPICWRMVEDATRLLEEPILLSALLRELIGDQKAYGLDLFLWPGAYDTVVFSNGKSKPRHIARLRQTELAVVFRGTDDRRYTADLRLDRGRYSFGNRSRRLIFSMYRERIDLLVETLKAQRLRVHRIKPMDAGNFETILERWHTDPQTISAAILLEEGVSSMAILKNGAIQSLCTLPDEFGALLAEYRALSGMDGDTCRRLILETGLQPTEESAPFEALADRVLVTCRKMMGEFVRTLDTAFGAQARVAQILLCGTFAHIRGLQELFSETLGTKCVLAEAENSRLPLYGPEAFRGGVDLLSQRKREGRNRTFRIAVTALLLLAAMVVMVIPPLGVKRLRNARDEAAAQLQTPAYMEVQTLLEQKDRLTQEKIALEEAVEALPHGDTQASAMVAELLALTESFGTVSGISVDYPTQTLRLSFTTSSYGLFVGWQDAIEAHPEFSFAIPPSFQGNGVYDTVEAVLTATHFENSNSESGVSAK